MSEKVVSITSKHSSKNAQELILGMAREVDSGTVAAIAAVMIHQNGDSDISLSLDGEINADTLIGALERLKADVIRGDQ